ETIWKRPDVLGITCDLTDAKAIDAALDTAVRRFGGVDMVVLNAGIFPSSAPIQSIAADSWRSAMTVNVEANLLVMQACHPLLKLAPGGGRIAVIGSKNVPAPGPGAAAYSASKAALNQLARVAALEWAKDGIRINSLHPNQVFDTALWTADVLAARAKAYNLTVEQYKRNNLLRASRPTAVNLFWALDRMKKAVDLEAEAKAIYEEDIAANRAIGELGARLIKERARVMTHCNAGALATAGYGTALGVIRSAKGKKISVIANETRPYLQGARLTAWEMVQENIPCTLITDNMAGHLMSRGEVDVVIVGADRIAANGDVANKIGTY